MRIFLQRRQRRSTGRRQGEKLFGSAEFVPLRRALPREPAERLNFFGITDRLFNFGPRDQPARVSALETRFAALHTELLRDTPTLATDAIQKILAG